MKAALLLLSVVGLGFTFYYEDRPDAAPNTPATYLFPDRSDRRMLEGVSDVATVVERAQAFKAMLSQDQISTLQQTYSATLAHRWSNLPCGSGCRNGIQFSNLTADQLNAALAVIEAASGSTPNEGHDEFMQIRTADSLLGTKSGGGGPGGGGYGAGVYFIAFLNEPSATGPWMLQYGGHHYAANIAFNNGQVIGASPFFEGVEPLSFTAANGQTYAPLDQEHQAMVNMLASLDASQSSTAHLSTSFGDVLLGPNKDGQFPTSKVGLAVSTLSSAQKILVLEAMKPWVHDVDDATAATLLAIYESELDGTYIAWSGGTGLNANGNYARIDGPSVWIEFVCQNGVVFPNQIHYHTVWRDHTRDYGADLTGPAISGVDERGVVAISSIYPNPARDVVNVSFPGAVSSVQAFDVRGHRVIALDKGSRTSVQLDISTLPNGDYTVQATDGKTSYTGRFTRVR